MKQLTASVIACAIKVHKTLGNGFLESVYESALAHEFRDSDIAFERQARMQVLYEGRPVGAFVADFVVEDKLVLELKALAAITSSCEAQLLNYLKASGLTIGLILNFGATKLQISRKVWNLDE